MKKMKKCLERDQRIFEYIKDTIRRKGYPPTIRDICRDLEIKSTSTVHVSLARLEKNGMIEKENGKSRSLRIDNSNSVDETDDEKDYLSVPIIGKVTAGIPILAVENYEGTIHFPKGRKPMPAGDLFALSVRGTSMIEAGIMDGDYVIVERTSVANNGDIVVALIEDEATVKTFYQEDGHFRLQPENKTMLPIIVNSLMILGKVVASVRYY